MKLKTWLKENNIQNKHFAEMVGVTPVAVCRWVTGKKRPSLTCFAKITELTNGLVTAEDFLEETPAPSA